MTQEPFFVLTTSPLLSGVSLVAACHASSADPAGCVKTSPCICSRLATVAALAKLDMKTATNTTADKQVSLCKNLDLILVIETPLFFMLKRRKSIKQATSV